ncbi:hypothetical protein MBLNU230_g5250t1 [Neophaeotheca triangularis]
MSPSIIPLPVEHVMQQENFFDSFALSTNAFLPETPPLQHLTDEYYIAWEDLIGQLPSLIKRRTLRPRVLQLPILSTSHLSTEEEWRRAYVILTFIAHGYIWGGQVPAEILPPPITIPLLAVSRKLDLPPVATYAALCLWNFKLVSSTRFPGNLDAVSAMHTFTGLRSESWFYMVSVAMEAQAGALVPLVLSALQAIADEDYFAVRAGLFSIAACIKSVTSLLTRMYEQCDPEEFFHRVRPFLAGSKGMAEAGLPNGVFYDTGDGQGEWKKLRGGSNGQSSMIQFFDVILGVTHSASGHTTPHGRDGEDQAPTSFQAEVRAYMPGPHRQFLEHMANVSSLRSFALRNGTDPGQEKCRMAYQSAIDALTALRNEHLKIVTRYIVVPSRSSTASGTRNLASVSVAKEEDGGAGGDKELTGTGGTSLLPFLKQSRDETVRAGCSVAQPVP